MKTILLLTLIIVSTNLFAKSTFWEIGVGAASVNLPLYPGSSQNDNFLIPFPIFRIQSKYFEIDDGVRGFIYESPNMRFNISADLGVPVNSEDSDIRNGMPDLDTVVQIGPSLEIIFAGGRKQPSELRLELPVRTAIATDIEHANYAGWIFEPRLTYETLRPFKVGFTYQVSSGFRYATKDYHAYYYDVPQQFAIATRPAYESERGYSGFFLDIVGNWRQQDLVYFVFTRYQNLNSTVYEDSPLVEDTNYLSVGMGLVWYFASSNR